MVRQQWNAVILLTTAALLQKHRVSLPDEQGEKHEEQSLIRHRSVAARTEQSPAATWSQTWPRSNGVVSSKGDPCMES